MKIDLKNWSMLFVRIHFKLLLFKKIKKISKGDWTNYQFSSIGAGQIWFYIAAAS